jgi:hypothetical protein
MFKKTHDQNKFFHKPVEGLWFIINVGAMAANLLPSFLRKSSFQAMIVIFMPCKGQ